MADPGAMYFADPPMAAQQDAIELQEGVYELPKNSPASTVPTDVNAPATNPEASTVRIRNVNVPKKKKKKHCDTKSGLIILAIISIIIAGGVGGLYYFSIDDNSKYNSKINCISV